MTALSQFTHKSPKLSGSHQTEPVPLSIVGGYISNMHQTSFQRRQLIFNAQLTALRAYSTASSKYNDILIKLQEFSIKLPTAHSSQEAAIQVIEEYSKIQNEYLKTRAETGLENLTVEVLFEIKQSPIKDISLKIFPKNFAPLTDEKERVHVISALRQEVDMLKSEIINFNNQTSAYMEQASKFLHKNKP
jgi:hypothetical protein